MARDLAFDEEQMAADPAFDELATDIGKFDSPTSLAVLTEREPSASAYALSGISLSQFSHETPNPQIPSPSLHSSRCPWNPQESDVPIRIGPSRRGVTMLSFTM